MKILQLYILQIFTGCKKEKHLMLNFMLLIYNIMTSVEVSYTNYQHLQSRSDCCAESTLLRDDLVQIPIVKS